VINFYTVEKAVASGNVVGVLTAVDAVNVPIAGVTYWPLLFSVGQIRRNPFFFVSSMWKVWKTLRLFQPDLVHILVEPYLIYFAFLKKTQSILTVVGTYSISIFKKSAVKFLYRYALNKIDMVTAISRYTEERFRTEICYEKKIPVITLGVDIDSFRPGESSLEIKKEKAFCFVGHIKPRKGLIYVLRAMALLKDTHEDIKLYVAGLFDDPQYSQICRDFIESHGLQGQVKFLGLLNHSQVQSLYSKSVLNLLPSFNSKEGSFEGFGLIHLEANAAGTLTLGSLNTGNECAIKDNSTGFLISQENEIALAEKMKLAIDIYQSGDYRAYASNCLQHARSQSWDNYYCKLNKLYSEVGR
jgi:glycosyltransferase involved in cell wall biosynthesis